MLYIASDIPDNDIKNTFLSAQKFRIDRQNPKGDHSFLDRDTIVNEITAWNKFLELTIASADPTLYLPFIYHAFRNFIELDMPPPCCMLCFNKNLNIADSHYDPKNILKKYLRMTDSLLLLQAEDDTLLSAEKITFKLFCKDDSTSCEQKLSKRGESDFAEKFIPFLDVLRQKVSLGSSEACHLDYGPWLYYLVISLVYRLLLVDFGQTNNNLILLDNDNFNKENTKKYLNPLWQLFTSCRDYLLDRPNSTPLLVYLYASENGLLPNILKEHPLMHCVHYRFDLDELTSTPNAIYGFGGLYFVVANNINFFNHLNSALPKSSFHSVISLQGGVINIPLGKSKFVVPDHVKKSIKIYHDHLVRENARRNPSVVSSEANKRGSTLQSNLSAAFESSVQPDYTVHLPKGLKFNENVPAGSWWAIGHLLIADTKKYELLTFHVAEPPSRSCSWLLRHKFEKYWFSVIHIQSETGPHVIFAVQFNHNVIPPNYLMHLPPDELEAIDLQITPLKGTDHSNFDLEDKTMKVTVILALLVRKFYEEQKYIKSYLKFNEGTLIENDDNIHPDFNQENLILTPERANIWLFEAFKNTCRQECIKYVDACKIPSNDLSDDDFKNFLKRHINNVNWLNKEVVAILSKHLETSIHVFNRENDDDDDDFQFSSIIKEVNPKTTKAWYLLKITGQTNIKILHFIPRDTFPSAHKPRSIPKDSPITAEGNATIISTVKLIYPQGEWKFDSDKISVELKNKTEADNLAAHFKQYNYHNIEVKVIFFRCALILKDLNYDLLKKIPPYKVNISMNDKNVAKSISK